MKANQQQYDKCVELVNILTESKIHKVELLRFSHDVVKFRIDENGKGRVLADLHPAGYAVVSNGNICFSFSKSSLTIDEDGVATMFAKRMTGETLEDYTGRNAERLHCRIRPTSGHQTVDGTYQVQVYLMNLLLYDPTAVYQISNLLVDYADNHEDFSFCINHMDNVDTHNWVENLEITTSKYNLIHSKVVELIWEMFPEYRYEYTTYNRNTGGRKVKHGLTLPVSINDILYYCNPANNYYPFGGIITSALKRKETGLWQH